ncbi:MAG: glycosyltransferase family 39 protein [Gemmatimonadaceae bacterium]
MTSPAGQTVGTESQAGELSRSARCMILALALLHLVLAWLGRNAGIGWGEDDAQYFNLARDLTRFSYHERWDIAAPFHARYPPLFPLLLAVVGVPSGWNIDVMLFFVALMSAVTIVILADAVRRRFGIEVALVVALLLTVNPMWLQDAGVLMSEALFKFFLAIALWGIARDDKDWRCATLAGAAVIAAALTRTAGISLVVGIVAYWLWRRRFRWVATFVVVAGLTLGAWTAISVFAPDAQNHRLYVSDI